MLIYQPTEVLISVLYHCNTDNQQHWWESHDQSKLITSSSSTRRL